MRGDATRSAPHLPAKQAKPAPHGALFISIVPRTGMTKARTGREGVSMAEVNSTAPATGGSTEPQEPGTGAQAAQPSEPQTVTREEYDKLLAESRKWESRAKENREAAKRLAEMEEANKSDAEKLADATKRAEEAEAKIAEYERAAERAEAIREVAAERGIDADILARMAGDTREEIEGNAEFIAAKLGELSGRPIYPSVVDAGHKPAPAVTKADIEAIKDPMERLKERAKHIDLYQ